MSRYCKVCGNKIPEKRLEILPDTRTCVKHSNAERVAGFRIISGKTTYSELQIVSQETAEHLNKLQARKGQSPGKGVRFTGK